MTSIVSSTLNPRSYIYSSNSETLILQSATSESRLSFINSSYPDGSFRYLLGATSQNLTVASFNNLAETNIQTFSSIAGIPNVETFGSLVSSNIHFSPSAPNTSKLIIFRDDNPSSSTQFTGIGINSLNGAIEYRAPGYPYNINSHIFYAGLSQNTSIPLMGLQPNAISGIAQVSIGILPGSMGPTTSLALANDIDVAGKLLVQNIEINPTKLIQLDTISNRISSNIMPFGVVYANGASNQIDPSLIPSTFTGTYFKSYKNFGIGTRSPLQRLHVAGNQYISERLGIGHAYPESRLHVVESSANIPTVTFYNTAGGDVLQTFISSNTIDGLTNIPVLIVSGTHQGVGIGTSVVDTNNTLQVNGNIDCKSISTQNIQITNSIIGDVSTFNLTSYSTPFIKLDTVTSNSLNISVDTDINAELTVSGNLYAYGNTTISQLLNTNSDIRLKNNINKIENSLYKINSINGYTFNMISNQNTSFQNNRYAGVIAQEIQQILPEAVSTTPSGYLSVKYDSLIPLLIESIKELTAKVEYLEKLNNIDNNMDTL